MTTPARANLLSRRGGRARGRLPRYTLAMPRTAVLILAGLCLTALGTPALAQPPPATCSDWQECRRLALAAADSGEYELFHDLAWRAVQTGPRNDRALMYLLARAQALSNRPHDALVMLGRLADAGALPPDAIDNPDFARVRQLAGWPELEARIAALADAADHSMLPPRARDAAAANAGARPLPPPSPAATTEPAAATPAEPAAAAPAAVPPPAVSKSAAAAVLAAPVEATRFRTDAFSVAGLAYDAVSLRYLFGDRRGRKLRVVGDKADHAVDLARADSGGFRDVSAIAIDARRGDLWAASDGEGNDGGLLHKLQLISGRMLKTFPVAADGTPVKAADLAVTPDGTVLLLDAGSPRLLALRPGQTNVEVLARLNEQPSSVAASEDDVAYVAHAGGVSRVEVHGGRVSPVRLPGKKASGPFEAVRIHRKSLIAIERRDGARQVVQLDLNDRGTAVTKARPLADLPADGQISTAVHGDDLFYVIDGGSIGADGAEDVVVYRISLK